METTLACWDGYEGAGGPVVSGDGPSLPDAEA